MPGHRGAHGDRRVRDARMPGERVLDLARLDPDAADLDLAVEAAEEVQHPVGVLPHVVAGAVPAVDEALGGGGRVEAVAARDPRAADQELAVVGDARRVAGQRAADRQRAVGLADLVRGAQHGRLGRAVAVDEPDMRVGGVQPAGGGGHGHVGARDRDPHAPEVVERVVDEPREHAGRRAQERDPALPDQAADRARVGPPRRRDDQPRALHERAPQLEHGDVEGQRRDQQHDVVAARHHVAAARQQGQHVRVRHLDALRAARRARRVHHVREPLLTGRGVARTVDRHRLRVERQHRARPRVLEDRLVAGGRVGGIERHVGRARAQHAEQRDDCRRRALDVGRHHVARPHALAPQPLGDAVGARQQLAVGQRLARVLDRGRAGIAAGVCGDQPVEGSVRAHGRGSYVGALT